MGSPWFERYQQACLRAMGCDVPPAAPSPGERHLLAVLWPTFHASVIITLTDLGSLHELAAAAIDPLVGGLAFDLASGQPRAPVDVAPVWHRAVLPGALLDALRSRLDALPTQPTPPDDSGRDGLHASLWLRDGRGRQHHEVSTVDPTDGVFFELLGALVDLGDASLPGLAGAWRDVRGYLRERPRR